jgi:hypothetical protein
MLVAISGSQSAGKTTVLNRLSDLGFKTIQRKSSRSILSDWNVTLQEVNNNPELTIKFQDEIILRKHQDEQEAVESDELWFGERSFADLFTYSLVALGHDNRYSEWLNSYYKLCLINQQSYKHVYYLKAGYFNVVKDGVRGDNKHYSRMVDLAMLDYTQQMTMSQNIDIIQTPDIEERVAMISIQQNYKKGEY